MQNIAIKDGQLRYIAGFVDVAEQQQLYQHLHQSLAWQQDQIKMFGRWVSIPRLQAWYGDADALYRYSGILMEPLPWTESLYEIKHRIEQACQCRFNSVLANLYRNGLDKMGYHADNEKELGPQPVIASLSLGCPRKFVLKHQSADEKIALELAGGSLLVMAGNTQQYYKHAIMQQKRVVDGRINLTYRFTYPLKTG